MRFSRLRLHGFKSFVDPTDLVIADGLTGVVGPNGCGKSNLLEALRWVMGENRPTAMRGGGMEDVIFAGAASRPARHFAEVALSLDNADRTAPAGLNDADALDVVRRITRDAGSAYKLNGRDARARDVQMLFADASTGAHSPALVRQGQISELIAAKPQKRRRILEEAAGISGLYQRRHEAELRLDATVANLRRVDDVIEGLAGQLTSLARQARQAARYREIGVGLRHAEGLLLYRRWRTADDQGAAADDALRDRSTAAAAAERLAGQAEAARENAEAAMPDLREEDAVAGAILQRLIVRRDTLAERDVLARETIVRLEARIVQLDADAEREDALNRDAGETIARLMAEEVDLVAADAGQDAALEEAQVAAAEAGAVLSAREAELATLTEEFARLAARHQSVTRLEQEAEARLARTADRARAARVEVGAAREKLDEAEGRTAAVAAVEAKAQEATAAAERATVAAEADREAAQDAESRARVARAQAEGVAGTLQAEAEALAGLLARDAAEGAPLLDRVTVEPGYEAALGAACGDALRASEIGAGDGEVCGWERMPPYDDAPDLPDGVESLGLFVEAPDVMGRRLSQIGVVAADRAAEMQPRLKPGQVLVSVAGDLWRWDGYRVSAKAAPSAAALRLRQANRLAALRADLEEATARSEGARAAHETLLATLTRHRTAETAAREARRDADRAVAEAGRARAGADGDRGTAASRLETARMAVARFDAEILEARTAEREASAARRALSPLDSGRSALEILRTTVEGARVAMITRRAEAEEVARDRGVRDRRLAQVSKELASWRARLDSAGKRLGDLTARRTATGAELVPARSVPADLATQRDALAGEISRAQTRQQAAGDALARGEAALRDALQATRAAERAAGDAREARARAEARADAAREARADAEERIEAVLGCTPAELLAVLRVDADALEPSETIAARVETLRRQRDALGAVNLRAEEDAREIGAEHDQLLSERTDLDQAVSELRTGIAALNREGRQRLLDAFETVNANFGMLFRHLFQGGEAKLELIESDDPLEAGLEILCQPPGKKLATLSLLSGGEQTLTALALIFAVFLANPAPICVLDEVDAPLDDANVTRFCDMLDEMTRRTQTRFLVITHHAVTMARMDRLFGVTMVEQGVSQLVSVDLRRAEAMVA